PGAEGAVRGRRRPGGPTAAPATSSVRGGAGACAREDRERRGGRACTAPHVLLVGEGRPRARLRTRPGRTGPRACGSRGARPSRAAWRLLADHHLPAVEIERGQRPVGVAAGPAR